MKLTINKKTISHYLEYNFIFVICFVLLSYVALYSTLNYIHRYKDEEIVNFFIEGNYIKDEELSPTLISNIDGLCEVNYNICSSTSSDLATIYEGYFATSDIYILREQDYIDMQYAIKNIFMPIDDNFSSSILNDKELELTYFDYENTNYAIKIYDKDDEEFNSRLGFINFIEFDKDIDNFYMSFNLKSNKFNKPVEENGTFNSIALETVSYLFARYVNE